jgi:hypothetical protein
MQTDVSPIEAVGLQPGDVVLTALAGPLSSFIQRVAGVPVSHAAIMVTAEVALEARDDQLELSETTGRAFWATIGELINHDSIDYVVVRRPTGGVDVERLKAWAIGVGSGDVPFASAGLTMMGALKLWSAAEARVIGDRLHSQRLGRVGGWLRRERRELAEAIADGPVRLICAELVYRGLHAADVRLDFDGAEFATAISDLPDVADLVLDPTGRDLDAEIGILVDERITSPGPVTSAPERRPRLRRAASNLRTRWIVRHQEVHAGDRADLITPRDLLLLDPLTTVATFERHDQQWHQIDAGS